MTADSPDVNHPQRFSAMPLTRLSEDCRQELWEGTQDSYRTYDKCGRYIGLTLTNNSSQQVKASVQGWTIP